MDDRSARMMIAYETAVSAMPPLTRTVYLMQRVKDLSYGKIGRRLDVDGETVTQCMGHALLIIALTMNGGSGSTSPDVAAAEARMAERYRAYCAAVVRTLGPLDFQGANERCASPRPKGRPKLLPRLRSRLRRSACPRLKEAVSYDDWLRCKATMRPLPE